MSNSVGIGRLIWRIVWVPVAFLLSTLVGLWVAFTLGHERFIQGVGGRSGLADWIGELVADPVRFKQTAQLIATLASALTIVPAVLLVVVGEVARIRSAIYYVLGGAAAVVAVPVISRALQAGGGLVPSAPVLQVLATAGFAAGFAYWLLAGRSA